MPSPKYCPVCGERTWSYQDTGSESDARRSQSQHIHANHLEHERWIRRVGLSYCVISIVVVLIPLIILEITLTSAARIFLLPLFLAVTLIMGGITVLILRRGAKRFRDLWSHEHGALANPLRNHTSPVGSCSPEFLIRNRLRCSERY